MKFGLLTSTLVLVFAARPTSSFHDGRDLTAGYSNEWVVALDEANRDSAQLIALKLGYEYVGELPAFPGHFLMRKLDHPVEDRAEASVHTRSLEGEVRVLWAQQLFRKTRVKRRPPSNSPDSPSSRLKRSSENMDESNLLQMIARLVGGEDVSRGIPSELLELWAEEEKKALEKNGGIKPNEPPLFNDLLWDHQWYMRDTRTRPDLPSINLNVIEAFSLGYSGKGIRVNVIDDGLEYTHDDLKDNYDASISWDYNNGTSGDPDPYPRYPVVNPADPDAPLIPNSHGTRCAGEIAMVANNGVCGVGVAHNAKIGAIKMLDGIINDRIEGVSLTHALDKVDIFTASWGPSDDGKTVEAPGILAQKALEKGVTKGRQGKGIIYVWAAGNGGAHSDNCNCDGYTSSKFTLSIGSASEQGEFPWYGERCSSTMASTYSSGAYTDQKIATTDTNNTCTVSHTGTSAAAPLAAGIIALGLEANPYLTWRDVQHLVIFTADPSPLRGNPGWQHNAAGLTFNSRFGFGVMNAGVLVKTAKEWRDKKQNAGEQVHMEIKWEGNESNSKLSNRDTFKAEFEVKGDEINALEHVEVTVNVKYPLRGVLEIVIVSPERTISQLLTTRPEDQSNAGFVNWTFMTVHLWGEKPQGIWKLYIVDRTSGDGKELSGLVGKLSLGLFGTKEAPPWLKEFSRMVSDHETKNAIKETDVFDRLEAS